MWGRGLPILVPIPHQGRGCCWDPDDLSARTRLIPGAPRAASTACPLTVPLARGWEFWGWVIRVVPAVPSLTSISPQGCRADDAGAVPQGRIFPSALGNPDRGSPACAGGTRDVLWDSAPGTLIPRRLLLSQGYCQGRLSLGMLTLQVCEDGDRAVAGWDQGWILCPGRVHPAPTVTPREAQPGSHTLPTWLLP